MDTSTLRNKLLDHGVDEQVVSEINNLNISGVLNDSDLDERALEALKELTLCDAECVLGDLKNTPNIQHVSNKSALLCSLIKELKQKHKRGDSVGASGSKRPGPDEAALMEILERTNYSLDVTSGQRKYGGPPPDWQGAPPGPGHEIFCGKIPKDIFEDRLIPLFEECGVIWNLRLMIDPSQGFTKGFCFVTYTTREAASDAVKKFNGYEIESGKYLKVNLSVANMRLFVGNIPKNKSREDILDEFKKHTDGLVDVIIYNSPDNTKMKNRGFSFLEYDSHKSASTAKHKIGNGWTRVWGCDILVDWAEPLEEPSEEVMKKVKVLYVRNLKCNVTDDQLREAFEKYGKIERVKKVKDYCFVHFEERENAMKAMEELQGARVGDSDIQITWAKPPSESRHKDKRRVQFRAVCPRGPLVWSSYDDSYLHYYYNSLPGVIPMGRGRRRRRGAYPRDMHSHRSLYVPRGSYRPLNSMTQSMYTTGPPWGGTRYAAPQWPVRR